MIALRISVLSLSMLVAWALVGAPEVQAQSCVANTTLLWEDPTGSLGRDVLLEDFDGDGDLDALLVRDANSVLYRNDGAGNFAISWTAPVSESGLEGGAGDIDGDGDLDIALSSSSTTGVRVYRNDGTGSFTETWTANGNYAEPVQFGDLDGDGDQDLAMGKPRVRVFLNDGAGAFSGGWVDPEPLTLNVRAMKLGDLDGDGDLDIAATYYNSPNRVFLNNGAGIFTPSWSSVESDESDGMDLADVDGDGDLDWAVFNQNAPTRVYANNGMGVFSLRWSSTISFFSEAGALGDLDGDGDADMVVGDRFGIDRVYLNDGMGSFTFAWSTPTSHGNYGVALGDVDGDGTPEIVLASNDVGLSVYKTSCVPCVNGTQRNCPLTAGVCAGAKETCTGSAWPGCTASSYGPSYEASETSCGDGVDNDCDGSTDSGGLCACTSGGFFDRIVSFANEGSYKVVIADFNNDGRPDAATVSQDATQPHRLYLGDGTGSARLSWSSTELDATHGVAAGDFNGDGNADIVTGPRFGYPQRVYLGDGNGGLSLAYSATLPINGFSVVTGHFNNDAYLDFAYGMWTGGSDTAAVTVMLGDGTGTAFSQRWASTIDTDSRGLAAGDLDGDGDLDLVASNSRGPNRVYLNNGDGSFANGWVTPEDERSIKVELGDLDNDGDLDLVFVNDGLPNRVYLNNGSATFTLRWSSAEADDTEGLALGDFDGNGRLDMAVGNELQPNRIYLGDGTGGFSLHWTGAVSDNTEDVAAADFDGDGDLDLWAANDSGEDRIYINDCSIAWPAAETCDGRDNDGNGLVDDGIDCSACSDNDGDGSFGTGPSCAGGDCDDASAALHPGALETCGDGVDNDCDGVIDDGCACDGVTCPLGQFCHGGSCHDPCLDDGDCTPPFRCYTNRCAPDPCTGIACPAGQICYGGSCTEACSGPMSCAPMSTCLELDPAACGGAQPDCTDHCTLGTAADPCQGVECPAGPPAQVCYGGSCFDPCAADDECTPPLLCYANRCAANPCDGVFCPSGQVCYGGACHDACAMTGDCSSGEACLNGGNAGAQHTGGPRCQDPNDPCAGVQCASEQVCHGGSCFESCSESEPCTDPGSVCYEGRCASAEDPACDGVSCALGQACFAGSCHDACDDRVECQPGHVCYHHACLNRDCSSVGGCTSGEVCYEGVCYEDCSGGDPCTDPNSACYDGRCAADACQAQLTDPARDSYHTEHPFTRTNHLLVASQAARPTVYARPVEGENGVAATSWIQYSSDTLSTRPDAQAPQAARVYLYLDRTAATATSPQGRYALWLTQGAQGGGQQAHGAAYMLHLWGQHGSPMVIADDPLGEGVAAHWMQPGRALVQVSGQAGETAGALLTHLPSGEPWTLALSASVWGDLGRWELVDGESGEVLLELDTQRPLWIRHAPQPTPPVHIMVGLGVACRPDTPQAQGVCARGSRMACELGELVCTQVVAPQGGERCNGEDDDCDGVVDEAQDLLVDTMEVQQTGVLATWTQWALAELTDRPQQWLNFTPRGNDHVGSSNMEHPVGQPVQRNNETVVAAARAMDDGGLVRLPLLHGRDAVDDEDSLQEIWMRALFPGPQAASWQLPLCWADDLRDRMGDQVPRDGDDNLLRMQWWRERTGLVREADAAMLCPVSPDEVAGGVLRFDLRLGDANNNDGDDGEGDDDDDDGDDGDYDGVTGVPRNWGWGLMRPDGTSQTLLRMQKLQVRLRQLEASSVTCPLPADQQMDMCVAGVYTCDAGALRCAPAGITCGCSDLDGDGHDGLDALACPTGTDCDDSDASVFPRGIRSMMSEAEKLALDTCDGKDNNCDGVVDGLSDPDKEVCPGGAEFCGATDCGYRFACVCDPTDGSCECKSD